MKNRVLKISITFVLIAGILSAWAGYKQYCIDPVIWEAMGLDPNADSSWESYKGETEDQVERAMQLHPELFDGPRARALQQQKNAATQAPAPSASAPAASSDKGKSGKSGKAQESKKITVYFTDLYGHVIGSSQVTAGTTIAGSQFPKSVEDVDGHSFDKWDYDGKEMYHDYIVRALYK